MVLLTNTENKNVSFKVKRTLAGMYGFTIVFMALLKKTGLKCLNETGISAVTVWKSKQFMDSLGQRLFQERPSLKCSRSVTSKDICLVVCLSQAIAPYPLTSCQECRTLFQDSKMPLQWGLPEHFLGNGQSKYSDELLPFTCAVCDYRCF